MTQLDSIVSRQFKSSTQLKRSPAPDTDGGKKKVLPRRSSTTTKKPSVKKVVRKKSL